MQKRTMKTEMVMLAVPAEMLLEAGIFEGDPMQMYVEGRRLVIENIDDTGDFVCDGNCADCPFSEIDCDGECESCPCSHDCDDAEVRFENNVSAYRKKSVSNPIVPYSTNAKKARNVIHD